MFLSRAACSEVDPVPTVMKFGREARLDVESEDGIGSGGGVA